MRLCKGKIVITPQKPMRLAGFAHRVGKFQRVDEDIFTRCVILEDDQGVRAAIFASDVLCVPEKLVEELRDYLRDTYNIPPEQVLFSATHTHSAPLLAEGLHPLIGEYEQAYATFFLSQAKKLVDTALASPVEVTCSSVTTQVALGVNRRLKTDQGIEMRPNFDGVTDETCTMLKFHHKEQGSLEAVLIHYACHANITDDNTVNPDYPGVTCGLIEQAYPGVAALFLQGCCGNIRPRAIIGDAFFRGHFEMAQRFGQSFFEKLKQPLAAAGIPFTMDIAGTILRTPLKVNSKIRADLSTDLDLTIEPYRSWHKLFAEHPAGLAESPVLQVQALRLGKALLLVAVNGEMVIDYTLALKVCHPELQILHLGYSNGMLGYIATAKQLEEGGYEAEDFLYYFGLPGKLDVSADPCIRESQLQAIKAVQ